MTRWLLILAMTTTAVAHGQSERPEPPPPPGPAPCTCIAPVGVTVAVNDDGGDREFASRVAYHVEELTGFGDGIAQCLHEANASLTTIKMRFRRGATRPRVTVPRGKASRCLAGVRWSGFVAAPRALALRLDVRQVGGD